MRACMQVLALLEAVFAKMEPALAQVVPSCFDDLTGVKRKLRYGTASHRRPRAAMARELRVHAARGAACAVLRSLSVLPARACTGSPRCSAGPADADGGKGFRVLGF